MAVMTGFPARFAFAISRFCNVGDRFDRNFYAEITARDHDTVTRGEDFVVVLERICALDLRNDEWMMPELFRSIANGVHVVDGLDERLADRVDTFTEREFETCTIVFGRRR